MQCENSKCKKKIINTYSCNKCISKFCCNSCMIDHYFDLHQNNSNKNDEKTNTTSSNNITSRIKIAGMKKLTNKNESVNSMFIKKGEFLSHIKIDDYFKYENFERVKIGKKLHVLGAGAFGDVYLIRHKKDGKFFAVKQMDKQSILGTGASFDIVRREIDIHGRLIHENIVRLFSHYEDTQSFYLIMEYANSGTLFSHIKKNRGFDEKRGFKYFIQTVSTIHFLHENKLIHRDIKPENLLLDDRDNIKLCDFGWCIELEIGNRNTFCGTIEYMAPELIRELPYDGSIDVWSLGILLYELLHGYSPFRSKNSDADEEYNEIFKNIIKYKFTIDKKELSENCKDLITKLLTPEINSRLKVKDIFSHPWVTGFDENRVTMSNMSDNKEKNPSNGEFVTNKTLIESNLVIDTSVNKEEKKKIPKPPSIKLENNLIKNIQRNRTDVELKENREKISHNLNSVTQLEEREYSFLQDEPTDSLFDKVLTQVKERNKDKRKKNKFIDHSLDMDVKKNIEVENKIILRVQRDKSVGKEINKKNDFKMFKEIKEIESDINKHIDDQNKKFESLQNKKEDLVKLLENNNAENNKVKLERHLNQSQEENVSKPNLKNFSIENLGNSKNLLNLYPKYINKKERRDDNREGPEAERNNSLVNTNYNEYIYGGQVNNLQRARDSQLRKNSILGKQVLDKLNKELDMSFLPKDVLYNDNSFDCSNKNLLSAIELLEKAQETKKEIDKDNKENKSFWGKVGSFLNPFKCGNNN